MSKDAISKFNRETVWLATGVLATLVIAALVLAVQEWQPKATQTERGPLLNASPATVASVIAQSSNSNAKTMHEQGSSVDHTFTEASLQKIPSAQTEPAASTPVLALAPAIKSIDAQANPYPGTVAGRLDTARAIGPKLRNARKRSSVASRSFDVKRRLIELWHQSLAKSAKSRNWTAFSNLHRGERKKAAYTAETNH